MDFKTTCLLAVQSLLLKLLYIFIVLYSTEQSDLAERLQVKDTSAQELKGHTGPVSAVCLTQDEEKLLTGERAFPVLLCILFYHTVSVFVSCFISTFGICYSDTLAALWTLVLLYMQHYIGWTTTLFDQHYHNFWYFCNLIISRYLLPVCRFEHFLYQNAHKLSLLTAFLYSLLLSKIAHICYFCIGKEFLVFQLCCIL